MRWHSPEPWRVVCDDAPHPIPKLTADGKLIDLTDFTISTILVAVVLSRIPRWGAHTNRFWSVGSHSFLMATHGAPADRPDLALDMLWHDAEEAYTGDIPTPTKRLFGVDTGGFSAAFREACGLPRVMPPDVHQADVRALVTEARHLFPESADLSWLPAAKPLTTYTPTDTPGGSAALWLGLNDVLREAGARA